MGPGVEAGETRKGNTMKTIEETLGLELVTNEYLVRKLRERAADEEWTNGDEAEAASLNSYEKRRGFQQKPSLRGPGPE